MMEIILGVIFYPVLLILYFVMKYYGKRRNGRLFSCDMKAEWMEEPEVLEIERKFKREMNRWLLLLSALVLPTFFIFYFSIVISYWMMWMVVVIISMNIAYARAYSRIRALKLEKGWIRNDVVLRIVDLETPGMIRTISPFTFLVPIIVSLAGFFYSFYVGNNTPWGLIYSTVIVGSFFSSTILFTIFAYLGDRKKPEIICSDSNVNLNYNRASKKIWKQFWVFMIDTMALITVVISATLSFSWNTKFVLWVSLLLIPIVCGIVLWILRKKMQLEQKYHHLREDLGQGDEQFWIGGQFYYNPLDTHSTVENRVGVGVTVNMATKWGKAFIIFLLLVCLSLPLIGVGIIRDEFTPLQLNIQAEQLIGTHTSEKYKIKIEDISSLKLITSLPKMYRTNGTGLENLNKGVFSVGKYGGCEVLLNPQNHKFIQFQYHKRWYFLGGNTDEQTQKVYNQLMDRLNLHK